MSPTATRPATPKQLRYLRQLAQRAGQTFATPTSSAEASREIQRLKAVAGRGFTFAEVETERHARELNGDAPMYAPSIRPDEVRGYGSNCRWSH